MKPVVIWINSSLVLAATGYALTLLVAFLHFLNNGEDVSGIFIESLFLYAFGILFGLLPAITYTAIMTQLVITFRRFRIPNPVIIGLGCLLALLASRGIIWLAGPGAIETAITESLDLELYFVCIGSGWITTVAQIRMTGLELPLPALSRTTTQ